MRPDMIHITEAYLDAKVSIWYCRLKILLDLIASAGMIWFCYTFLPHTKVTIMTVCCLFMLGLLVQLYRIQHRAGVLNKLMSGGSVVRIYYPGKTLKLEYLGEMFEFKKVGESKGAYVLDFKKGTFIEGISIQEIFTA